MGTAHRVTGYQLLGSNVPGVSPVSRNRAEISTFKYVPHKRNQKKGAQWDFNGDMGKPMSLYSILEYLLKLGNLILYMSASEN
jgi:hypothetical protein